MLPELRLLHFANDVYVFHYSRNGAFLFKAGSNIHYHLSELSYAHCRVDMSQLQMKHDNIKLFSFCTRYDITCNLDNYKDQAHYGDWINTMILNDMAAGDSLITKENCDGYFERERELYMNFDYEGLH